MSNLAVVNFAVGGTLTVSGKTTLAETVLSSSSGSFQGLSTTSLNTTGTSTFTSLPTSTQTPTLNSQLTTKVYVDTADTTLNNRISKNDTDVRTYIDNSYNELNNRVSTKDTAVRTYIDASYNELNNRVSKNDTSVRTYIDNSYNELNTKLTDTNNSIRPNRNYTIKQNADFFTSKFSSNPDRTIDFFQFGSSTYIECQNNSTNSPYTITLDNPKICGGLMVYIWNNSPLLIQIGSKTAPFFIKGRTNQNEKIQSGATMFLISNSIGWVVLDDSPVFKSAEVLQMLVYSQYNANRLTGVIQPDNQDRVIFQGNLQPKSNNSQIHITFDTDYSIRGGGFDEWESKITLNPNTGDPPFIITYKSIKLNSDNRNSSMILFPLSAGYSNSATNVLSFSVIVRSINSDDVLEIKGGWNMTISEVEN